MPARCTRRVESLMKKQHIDPPESGRIDGEEIARDYALPLTADEPAPGKPIPRPGRSKPGGSEDPTDTRGSYLDPETAKLTGDPLVSPQRVLPREPQHQLANLPADLRAPGTPPRIPPAPVKSGHALSRRSPMRLFDLRRLIVGGRTGKRARGMGANWLAWPTLSAGGGGQIKTAGVYYRKDALRTAIAKHGSLVMATLSIETKGEYAGAVRVNVDGLEVGSIPHGQSSAFRDAVEQLHREGKPATCRAELEMDESPDDGYVDVFIWAAPLPRAADEPFLPLGGGPTLQLFDGQAERLDEGLHSKARGKRVVRPGEVLPSGDGWLLALDGANIGTLGPESNRRLREAQEAGFPLTCRVRLIRDPDRPFRVAVDLPRD